MKQAPLVPSEPAVGHARKGLDIAIRFLLYPLLAAATLVYLWLELTGSRSSIGQYYGAYLAALVVVMVVVEAAHPMRREWRKTWVTFWRRDLPFLLLGASTLAFADWVAARAVTAHALSRGELLADVPLLAGVAITILISDFVWYWVHRLSHEARGRHGRHIWRVHAAHHLPAQVYVLMHAIAHPINTLVVRAILTLPAYFLGFSPEVVFTASVVTGFQGLVSHFNVDSRVGWLNYILVGTELHRYHHSANLAESKNFGAVVSLWDQLFGTFVYRPGRAPEALGVEDATQYPSETQLTAVLAYPFARRAIRSV